MVLNAAVQPEHKPGIFYDGTRRLFRLRCKASTYAFRVDDQRNLEHLYWGGDIPSNDDITYLTRSHVPTPFDPRVDGRTIAEKLGLDELGKITEGGQSLTDSWRVFTREKDDPDLADSKRIKSRRLENASWRLWHNERRTGGDLNRDLSEGVLTKALGGKSPRGALSNVTGQTATLAAPTPKRPGDSAISPSPLHPDRADAEAPVRRHPSPRPEGAVRAGVQPRAHGIAHAGRSPPGASPVHTRPKGSGDIPASFSSSPFGTYSIASVASVSSPAAKPPHAALYSAKAETNGGVYALDAKSESLIAGLDLDGYRGSRQHFRAKLKASLRDGEESESRGLVLPPRDPGALSSSRPMSPSASSPAFPESLPSAVAWHSGLHSGLSAAASPSGARSPAVSGRGMGSRKPSFAALEAHAGTDTSGALFEVSQISTPTNWEQLDPEVLGKSSKLLEFSDVGTGDFREPSFKVRYDDGSTVSPLIYLKHRIYKGKAGMKNYMPSLYVESPDEATTLVVEMVDPVTELRVNLYYTVYHHYDVIARRAVVENYGDKPVKLTHLASATVDFDTEAKFYMTQLSGGWARERQVVTRKLDDGLTVVKSGRGASSHQFNPFIVISPDREPEEKHGDCYAFCLVYSGNFLAAAEVTEYGRLRVNLGINPEGFTWALPARGMDAEVSSFESPELVMSYSNEGLGGMSRSLHRIFRERLAPRMWRYKVPPVLLNTWEALYFDITHEDVVDIARKAATCGIELLVLDDGWFGKRNNTYSGLGDWTPNMKKLPHGLEGLAREVNELGMKFGIWVEPEMVSMDSDLYRAHPDWCLHVPSRARTVGRNQLVLDFSRQCVRDNIFEQLRVMLASANIAYVKWDMNRHLTEVFSQDWDRNRQGEIAHRYMMGVYEVFARITSAFPTVLFESCSGGGGRFDAGMLFFAPQIWASDNTDALSRVQIQYGTSLAYPASAMGAHVSTVPNHQTLRSTTVKTRSLIAMSGTFGYELDPREMAEKEVTEVQSYIALHKRIAPLVYEGDMYRLWNPFTSISGAWIFVSQSKRHAVVIATNMRRDVGRLEPRLRLDGLEPGAIYNIEELCPGTMARNADTGVIELEPRGVYQYGSVLRLSGRTLCQAGLPMKFAFDSDSLIFELTEQDGAFGIAY